MAHINDIYLDYQATTPTDPRVIEEMLPYFFENFYNPSASNKGAVEIRKRIDYTRDIIANVINCNSKEVYFTSGATESVNLGIKGLCENQERGKIITLKTEHSAVLNLYRYLQKRGFEVVFLDVKRNGLLDLDLLEEAIDSTTILVSVSHVNNEIGVIQPLEDIGKICKRKNILLLVDGAQSLGKIEIDVEKCNISFMAMSGHKIYGPKGIGALYLSNKVKNKITPQMYGGGQEDGLRSGTLNVPGIIGLGKAVELSIEDLNNEQIKILGLRNLFLSNLQLNIKGLSVNGDMESRIAGNLNLSIEGISADMLINSLGNIIISRGSACNASKNQGSHVLKALGLSTDQLDSSIRIGFGRFTNEDDIKFAIKKFTKEINKIRNVLNLS